MNKDVVKNLALILLLGITAFSMVRYVRVKGEVVELTQEKQNLLQELEKEKGLKEQLALKNTNLKDYLRAGKNRIMRLFRDNSRIQNNLEDVSAKFSILKAENRMLIDRQKRIYLGNKEFKAGQKTIPAKIKIEVVPAQTKE